MVQGLGVWDSNSGFRVQGCLGFRVWDSGFKVV